MSLLVQDLVPVSRGDAPFCGGDDQLKVTITAKLT
jgi:hypothetical protein